VASGGIPFGDGGGGFTVASGGIPFGDADGGDSFFGGGGGGGGGGRGGAVGGAVQYGNALAGSMATLSMGAAPPPAPAHAAVVAEVAAALDPAEVDEVAGPLLRAHVVGAVQVASTC
jgi:hypothetical protein